MLLFVKPDLQDRAEELRWRTVDTLESLAAT
jgi:hypothetical protein